MHSLQILIQNQNLSVWGGGATSKMRSALQQILKNTKHQENKTRREGKRDYFKCTKIQQMFSISTITKCSWEKPKLKQTEETKDIID